MTKQKDKPDKPMKLWTLKEAADALDVSERSLARMIKKGTLQTGLFGRIPNDEILRLAGRPVVQ
jgi:hypothetical protein